MCEFHISEIVTLHISVSTFAYAGYRTVEINNTDAEGRLVLGDGVGQDNILLQLCDQLHLI